jgi:RHS repeat-associated protein
LVEGAIKTPAVAGLAGVTNTLTYDPFGRLASHARAGGTTTTYTVNALDQRMAKSNSGSNSRYVYAGFNQLLAEYTNGQWTSYLWNGNTPVAMVRNNQIYYIHTDHLGRPQLATDANRTVVWKASNTAFNRSVAVDAIGGLNLGFPGQYYDTEFGTWHNGYRDYLADTGKYLQSDPIGLGGGVNTYAYVGGNPISFVDPLGLETGAAFRAIYLADGGNPNPPSVGDHSYNIWVPMCAGGCTPTEAFNAMRNFSAPGAPPAQNGSHNLVLTGNNPINQTVDPCEKTITNRTLPGHQFGGSVTISIQQRNGVVGAQIVGTGVGQNPIMNQLMGPMIFEYLGYRAAGSLP